MQKLSVVFFYGLYFIHLITFWRSLYGRALNPPQGYGNMQEPAAHLVSRAVGSIFCQRSKSWCYRSYDRRCSMPTTISKQPLIFLRSMPEMKLPCCFYLLSSSRLWYVSFVKMSRLDGGLFFKQSRASFKARSSLPYLTAPWGKRVMKSSNKSSGYSLDVRRRLNRQQTNFPKVDKKKTVPHYQQCMSISNLTPSAGLPQLHAGMYVHLFP